MYIFLLKDQRNYFIDASNLHIMRYTKPHCNGQQISGPRANYFYISIKFSLFSRYRILFRRKCFSLIIYGVTYTKFRLNFTLISEL